ncbi:3'-5' exonuclease [Paraliobacillus sediminis]|uniref:3'-5' exonuclease n=1 Tax=Paraliobacillus sediminis TaxID=1885916 RepID=UPI000E3B8782|nr:3'-5' exonuclease [Paraliobacillus sediminis]
MDFVAIDFETANRFRDSACAVGIVVGNENGIIDEFYSLINPQTSFESHNIYVHGITERDVKSAPTFDEVWDTMKDYLDNQIVIAHNASFDMSVLRASLDKSRLPYPTFDYLCSVMLSKLVWPGMPNYKLNTLADLKGIMLDHHHALADSRAVIELLVQAMQDNQVSNIDHLLKQHAVTCGKVFERSYQTPKRRKRSLK